MFVVVLCASIMFTINCFQVKDFCDSTVKVTATVEQIEESQDGYFVKTGYDYDGKAFTDISWYESKAGYGEGETKEIRILYDNPDLICTQKSHIRYLYLSAGVFVISSCAFVYEIIHYAKKKKSK